MNWRKVLQLALVHAGVTITVVPVTSTLNRIMIADMQLSALFVSVLVALPYLLSPLQVIIGNWADNHPLWGRHRSPWIILGGLMASFGGYFTAHAVIAIQHNFVLGLGMAAGVFILWGVGVNVASVSYLSLVSDLSSEETRWRSRAVSVMWTVMILAIIATSLMLSHLLAPFSVQALFTAFGLVWMAATFCIFLGVAGLEPRASGEPVQHSADHPMVAFRLLAHNPTARRFFVYLVLVLVSIYAQDVVLEPFGAEVLHMPVALTARLTAIWGSGLLITLVLGVGVIRWIGKKKSANAGAVVAMIAFALVIFSGLLQSSSFFMFSVFLAGLGCGLLTIGSLSFMLDMTVPQAVGLYMGAWGVANFVGRALGTISGGLLRDLVYLVTGAPVLAYSAVFALEIAGLLLAIWFFRTISVEDFRHNAETRMRDILALAGD
jgi:BCD family chlorophyll transporter-like MFS transporter